MSVIIRKDGRVLVRWVEDGKRKEKGFGTGPAAEAKAHHYNESRGKKQQAHISVAKFSDIVQAYLDASHHITGVNLDNAVAKFNGVICPTIGDIQAHNITKDRLDKYVTTRSTCHRVAVDKKGRRRTYPPAKLTTIHRELSDIRAVLNWAVDREIIRQNPMNGYKFPKRDDEEILPATHEEVEGILSHASPHLIRAIVISYYVGLRPGAKELLSMRWHQIDWRSQTMTIISARKGGVTRRAVPIEDDSLLTMLSGWFKEDAESASDGYIITWLGRPVLTIKTAFKRAKEKAGIKRRLPIYAIRHAFVSQLLESGADIKTVSKMAGSDPATVMKWYQKTTDAMSRSAVSGLRPLSRHLVGGGKALGGKTPKTEKT